MNVFRLSKDKITTGLISIKPNYAIKITNRNSSYGLNVIFSNTDGKSEKHSISDEIMLENNTSYLRTAYSRFEVVIEKPQELDFKTEIHVVVVVEEK